MRKLIIGCGYLGMRAAKSWLATGHDVAALTRSAERAAELSAAGIRPIVGDICEPSSLTGLPESDTILFAVGFDRTSGHSQRSVYVDGLSNVLKLVAERTGHFIYISSSSVYGQLNGEWVDETSECHPVQPGGECCLAAEGLIHECFTPISAEDMGQSPRANVLRLTGIYGPGRLLTRVESLRAGEPISGNGDAWLNLIHVDDAVAAILACESRGKPDQTYLITDNQPVARTDYYGLLAKLIGAQPPVFNPQSPAARGSGGINKRCRNRRMRDELNLTLAYPTFNLGLPNALMGSVEPRSVPSVAPTG